MARSFALLPDVVADSPGTVAQRFPAVATSRQRPQLSFELMAPPPFSCDYPSLDVGSLIFDGCLGTVMPNGETVHEYNCSYWWSPEGLTKTPF